MKPQIAALAFAVFAAPVWATMQTVTLSVPAMTCSACPITVKHALAKVDGVAKTAVQKLTKATENAGYPSTVKT